MDQELVKTASLVLAILIPAIAAVYAYRREERKGQAAKPEMIAVGGAIATKEEGLQHTAALNNLSDQIEGLTERMDDFLTRADHRARLMDTQNELLIRLCRAAEEIKGEMRGSNDELHRILRASR